MTPAYRYSAEVLRILDGDTIEVSLDLGFNLRQRMLLRLYGLNAQELHDKNAAKRASAFEAKKFVDSHIGGKTVIAETVKPKDKFGRYLCNVYLEDGKCLNTLLLDAKLAQPWDGQGEKP